MTIRFSPHRQGFAHTLEPDDLLLLRGSPIYTGDLELDTRIVLRRDGRAARALWVGRADTDTPHSEFHHWEYRIPQASIDDLGPLLNTVGNLFAATPKIEGGETGDSLSFWFNDSRFTAEIHTGPPEAIKSYSPSQVDAFAAVRERICNLVPAQASVDSHPSTK